MCVCHRSWSQSLLPGWAFCLHWNSALVFFFPWSESQSWSDEHDRGRLSERSMDAGGFFSFRGHKAGPALDWWCLAWTSWLAGGSLILSIQFKSDLSYLFYGIETRHFVAVFNVMISIMFLVCARKPGSFLALCLFAWRSESPRVFQVCVKRDEASPRRLPRPLSGSGMQKMQEQ